MRVNNWVKLSVVATCCCVVVLADHGGSGKDNNGSQNGGSFSASVIGSTPGATVGGVASGGAPWLTREGSASLSSGGRLQVEVQGLLIGAGGPGNLVGTVGPVLMVAASVVCGGSGGTVAASSSGVPLSSAGNAQVEATLTLPASCAAPVVLVRVFNNSALPGAQLGSFIAVTGLNGQAAGLKNSDDPTAHQ